MLLHQGQELDGGLRSRTEENLSLARLLGVGKVVERVGEDAGSNHDCPSERVGAAWMLREICVCVGRDIEGFLVVVEVVPELSRPGRIRAWSRRKDFPSPD
jgi:hypothetical protein